MDLKQILLEANIEADKIDSLVSNINKQIGKEFVSKDQYNKKAGATSELQEKINDLEAQVQDKDTQLSKLNTIKENYDSITTEYNNYKSEVETKEANSIKSNKIRSLLKAEGFNEKMIPLLEKEFDVSKLEIEEDNIKGWDEHSTRLKEQYGDFISKVETVGAPPAKPIDNKVDEGDPFLQGFNK